MVFKECVRDAHEPAGTGMSRSASPAEAGSAGDPRVRAQTRGRRFFGSYLVAT